MKEVHLDELSELERRLVQEALAVRPRAYAPYSKFKVGAALVDVTGAVHTGCNVEGVDFTLTTHAEAGALNAMVKSGVLKFDTIAVVVKSRVGECMPCGLCRQKIREFASSKEVKIIGVNLGEDEQISEAYVATLDELLPFSFGPDNL